MNELFDPRLPGYLDSLVPERPDELRKMEEYAREHSFLVPIRDGLIVALRQPDA